MAGPEGLNQELGGEQQAPDRRDPAFVLGGFLALCAVPVWLFVILYGLVHGRIGDCWPTDQSSAAWMPVLILGILGLLCDLAVFGGVIRKDHALLRRAGLLSLVLFALVLILGPTALDLIGSRAPTRC